MTKQEAIKHFKGSEYQELILRYSDFDRYRVIHEDDADLFPIWIPLPAAPRWDLIDGFGLEPKEQVFVRKILPYDLVELQETYETLDEIWDELEANPARYRGVIDFIRKEVWHELNGYWCFINGKPTYFPGNFYIYINYWKGDEGFLQYRDRDLIWFLFQEYIERLYNFIGFNAPKPRRCGDTTKASAVNYLRTTRKLNANAGIQSSTEKHAAEVLANHIVLPWMELPFWLRPLYDGSSNPQSRMVFMPPATTAKTSKTGKRGALFSKNRGLGSKIIYRSSNEGAFDTYKMYSYHGDEVGKTIEADIYRRYYIIRPSLSTGSNIYGNVIHTSTVEDLTKMGGDNFKRLCDESMFEDQFRNASGRTTSWLANLFLPAYLGLEQFVGKYGESISDKPTPEQIEYMREAYPNKSETELRMGAKEFLEMQIDSFARNKNFVGMNNFKRMFPVKYRDCWIRAETDNGMPINKVEDRISELSLLIASEGNPVKKGNFIRSDASDPDSNVVWVDDPNGKFEVSYLHPEGMSNKRVRTRDGWAPMTTDFGIAGGDDFSAKKTEGKRMSNGGGAVFMYKLPTDNIDNIEQWTGHRFICLYSYRPDTTEEWGEDMIMMCQYYGVLFFPENNLYVSPKWFIDRGYSQYLKFEVDLKTRKFRKNAGWPNVGNNAQRLWRAMRDHFTLHSSREMHLSLLKDVLDIPGIEGLTDFDRFVGAGSCLLGADDFSMEDRKNPKGLDNDISKFFTKTMNNEFSQNTNLQKSRIPVPVARRYRPGKAYV